MGKFNFKAPAQIEERPASESKICFAYGCPRKPTINTGSWACRYHQGRSIESLDAITMLIKNHEREIDWREKVMNMPYHEFDILKGNAPPSMAVEHNETLVQYRARTTKHVQDLLKNPVNRCSIAKTYISMTAEID